MMLIVSYAVDDGCKLKVESQVTSERLFIGNTVIILSHVTIMKVSFNKSNRSKNQLKTLQDR